MATVQVFIIVGASLAGAKAAHALRQEGFTGRLVLIGDEAERPLPAAPLSKGYLVGRQDKAKLYVTTRAGGSAASRHHQKLMSSVRSGTEPC